MGNWTPRTRTQNVIATTLTEATAWATHLGCSVAELRIAVRAVGNSVANVRAYLAAINGREAPVVMPPRETNERSAAPDVQPPARLPVWPATRPSDL